MVSSLTRGQQAVYDYLLEHQSEFTRPPTLNELCDCLGLSSRGSLHKHVQALIAAGLIEPMDRKQRGIRLAPMDSAEDGIPFMGYIAAGSPIEAIANPELIEVPHFLQGRGEQYVLQVRGDSMIDAGILNGDWVIIEKRDHARNGEIVVALVHASEATLKRIEQLPDKVVLHPENTSMQAMHYRPDDVQIQGVLVGQMRQY